MRRQNSLNYENSEGCFKIAISMVWLGIYFEHRDHVIAWKVAKKNRRFDDQNTWPFRPAIWRACSFQSVGILVKFWLSLLLPLLQINSMHLWIHQLYSESTRKRPKMKQPHFTYLWLIWVQEIGHHYGCSCLLTPIIIPKFDYCLQFKQRTIMTNATVMQFRINISHRAFYWRETDFRHVSSFISELKWRYALRSARHVADIL